MHDNGLNDYDVAPLMTEPSSLRQDGLLRGSVVGGVQEEAVSKWSH